MESSSIFDYLNNTDEATLHFIAGLLQNNPPPGAAEGPAAVNGSSPPAGKSFAEISAFNDSPFGKNWDSRLVLSDLEAAAYNDDPPVSQWIYHIEQSADGRKLIEMYQNDNQVPLGYGSDRDNLTDISIYYETDDRYNTFGSICFIKMNDALKDYLMMHKNSREWMTEEIVKNEKHRIDARRLREAIDYELDTGSGMNILAKIGAKLLLKLGGKIRSWKYKENVWNPDFENYDPILPVALIDKAIKKWNSFKKDADGFFDDAKDAGDWLADNIPVVGEFLKSCIDTIVDVLSAVINVIDKVVQAISRIVRIIKLVNAFIAGVINECIEMAAGIIDLVALLLTMTDKAERQKIREALENILESYRKQPSKIIEQIIKGFEALQERYSSDKNEYQIAYQLGEDAVTVISWIGLIGGILKTIKNLPKAFKKLKAWADDAVKRVKAIEFSKVAAKLKELRFKYIDKKVINFKWRLFVKYAELSKSRILALQKLRQQHALLNKNVATLKVTAVTKEGTVITKEYIAHAGKGKKIPESTGAPQAKPSRDFMDYEYAQKRWLDSENKMLLQMDKDLEAHTIVKMTMEWESTFTPCTVCRREILIRQELYNAKVYVKSPKFKNSKGKKQHVRTSRHFETLLEQIK